jgi:hypothetical protein
MHSVYTGFMQLKRIDEPIGFDELWNAAGISKSLAEGWTNGRPFKVMPSLSVADGKGTRNIYTLADVYFIALLHQLKLYGFSSELLQRIVRVYSVRLPGQDSFAIQFLAPPIPGISFTLKDSGEFRFGPMNYDGERPFIVPAARLELDDSRDRIAMQVEVHLNKLRADVDSRLDSYRGKSKRDKR